MSQPHDCDPPRDDDAIDPTLTGPTRLVGLARELGVTLDETGADEVLTYLDAMLETNQHINLTAVRDRETAVVLHALDSVACGMAELEPRHVLDLGTGNGFPGVGVAALHPRATVTLMDRTGKKVRAIGTCLVTARLARIETLQMDAQQAPSLQKDLRHAFDLVTARAVARPEVIAQLADPLVRPGGHLLLWLEADAACPERLARFRRKKVYRYRLPAPAERERQLAHYER